MRLSIESGRVQTVLRHCAVPAFLRPMPFQKIRNLGGKLGTAVQETYQANTVGDLLYVAFCSMLALSAGRSGANCLSTFESR